VPFSGGRGEGGTPPFYPIFQPPLSLFPSTGKMAFSGNPPCFDLGGKIVNFPIQTRLPPTNLPGLDPPKSGFSGLGGGRGGFYAYFPCTGGVFFRVHGVCALFCIFGGVGWGIFTFFSRDSRRKNVKITREIRYANLSRARSMICDLAIATLVHIITRVAISLSP